MPGDSTWTNRLQTQSTWGLHLELVLNSSTSWLSDSYRSHVYRESKCHHSFDLNSLKCYVQCHSYFNPFCLRTSRVRTCVTLNNDKKPCMESLSAPLCLTSNDLQRSSSCLLLFQVRIPHGGIEIVKKLQWNTNRKVICRKPVPPWKLRLDCLKKSS